MEMKTGWPPDPGQISSEETINRLRLHRLGRFPSDLYVLPMTTPNQEAWGNAAWAKP